jgi:hypothetical protein
MLPVKLNTSKICFLVAVMIVSVSITEPGLAAEHQPLPGQSTSGERWLFVQQNIRKVMNMPEEKLLLALGAPRVKERSGTNSVLTYNMGDEVALSFELQDSKVHRCTLKPLPHFHLEECISGPHINWSVCPVLDEPTQENRWTIMQRNAPRLIGMSYSSLLKMLGNPDAQYGEGSMLAYHLNSETDLHFDMKNNRVTSYSINPHHAQEFFMVEPSAAPGER